MATTVTPGYPSLSGPIGFPSLSGVIPTAASNSAPAAGGALSLDALFDLPEPSIDFAAVRDQLLSQIATAQQNSSDMLAWAKDRAAGMDATLKPFVDASLKALESSTARSADYYKTWSDKYKPLQERVASEAAYGLTKQAQDDAATRAGQDVAAAHEAQRATTYRQMGDLGLDSGRFVAGINARSGLAQAADVAAARTRSRETQRVSGLDTAFKVGQAGNALAQLGLAEQQQGLQAGQGAVSATNATNAAELAGLDMARGWGSLALGATQNLMGAGLDVYKTNLNARTAAAAAIGQNQTMPRVGATGAGVGLTSPNPYSSTAAWSPYLQTPSGVGSSFTPQWSDAAIADRWNVPQSQLPQYNFGLSG